MPTQLKQTETGPASQYFSALFSAPSNLNLLENNSEASTLFLIGMTIADLFQFLDSKRCFFLVLLIDQQSRVFNCISVDDSISRQSISIFPSSRNRNCDIPCIFNLYQRSKVSTSITQLSIDLATLISIFEWILVSFSLLNFSVSNVEMAPDCEYLTLQNRI